MENKFSKFINLQGKYLTSLLILLALSIGNVWGASTASWDFESNATGLTISDAGSASTARAEYSSTGSTWTDAAGTYCIYANLGSTKGSSTTITTSSSYSNISAISMLLGTSDRGKTEFALQVSSKADFSSDVTDVQARVTIKDNISSFTANTRMYSVSYSISTPITGYVRITLAQASGSNNKKMCVDNLSITYTDGDLETYTVNYKDDEDNDLGSETVEVGSKPTATSINKNKDFYTFEAWQLSGLDIALDAASWASVAKDATVTLTARYSGPNYASTLDFAAVTVAGTTASNPINDFLASGNMIGSNLGSSAWETSTDKSGFIGYKLKNKSAVVKFLVKAGKKVVITFGNVGADVTLSKGDVNSTIPTAAGDDAETVVPAFTPATDMVVTITTSSSSSSTVTLKKIEILDTYTATRVDSKSDGAGSDANVTETTLPTPTAISGWTFTGWTANEDVKDSEEATKTAGTVLAAGTYTLLANTSFTAQWSEATSTYDITYVSAHGTAPAADNAASVVLAELSAEGWAHKGWTADVDVTVDAATVTAGTLIANGKTAILASDVEFTAVWKQVFTLTFDSKDGSAVAPQYIEDGGNPTAVTAPTKDDYVFSGWSETDGGAVVADITALTISGDKTLYAIWALDVQVSEIVFSNGFKAWINGSNIEVFYMAGESAPTIVSYDGKNLKAEGGVVISGDKIIATGTDESVKEFDLTMTAVAPLTTTGAQTFDGTEGYVKTRHAWTSDKKWKMSKHATDGRVARGETSMYIFLGAAESVTFDWGKQQKTNDVAVYVNGTFVKNLGKDNNSAVELTNGNNMVAFYSLQTSGDVWLNGLTVAPWVPVTAVALKEGEDPISAKEIWASTSFTLTAEVTPDNASNKTITWTSSDPTVATVADGVVTGVAANASPVTITASTVDGVTATCAVTVTAAPEPSAAPTISTQPAGANYYEGATIAALEVVATGAGTLTYQWYLGADAIDGAIAATYQPTVSAIGSYVYHCVVTNTEAGHLPTSLASSNATITIADDPAAIKLINGAVVNHSDFITGVNETSVEIESVTYNCVDFTKASSNRTTVSSISNLTEFIQYNATTNESKMQLKLYNSYSSAVIVYLHKLEEGAAAATTEEISVPAGEVLTTSYYVFNSTKNRSFYITCGNRNYIKVLQVKVLDNGATPMKQAGEAGYSMNFNKGRLFATNSAPAILEGMEYNLSTAYKPLNTSYAKIAETYIKFTAASDVQLAITTNNNKTYYVSTASDGTDNETAFTGEKKFDLTAGTWYIIGGSSELQINNIAFLAPRPDRTIKFDSDGGSAVGNIVVKDGDVAEKPADPTKDDNDFAGWYNGSVLYDWSTPVTSDLNLTAHWTAHVANDATLKSLKYGETDIALSDGVYTYNVNLPALTLAVPALTAEPNAALGTAAVTDAAEFDGAGQATSTVLVTAEDGDTKLTYTVIFTKAALLPQVDVTANTTWDWANIASENITLVGGLKNYECVLANVEGVTNDATFNSQALLFCGERVRSVENSRVFSTIGHVSFNVTVAGTVRVEFSDNGNNNRRVKINDEQSDASSSKTDVKTFEANVAAGTVTIMGISNDGTSSNQYVRISRIEFEAAAAPTKDLVRDGLSNGKWGTLCPAQDVENVEGAVFYQISYLEEKDGMPYNMVFDEISGTTLTAGHPYFFIANANEIRGNKTGTALTDVDGTGVNGFYGYIGAEPKHLSYLTEYTPGSDNTFVIYNNSVYRINGATDLKSERCYININATEPSRAAISPAPGRRRITMGVQNTETATGLDELNASETPLKVVVNGQFFIIRGEKMYDATGKLVK